MNDWWNNEYDVKDGSYFKITVWDEPWAPENSGTPNTSGVGGQTYDGWCVDYGRLAKTNKIAKVDILTSYDGDLHISETDWKKNAIDKPENLPNIAYLINHWNVGDTVAACNDDPEGNVIGWLEMQTAIWTIIDDETNHDSSPFAQGNYVGKRNECVMRHISDDALANGVGYIPDCTDENEQIPIIYIIDHDGDDVDDNKRLTDGTWDTFEEGDVLHQVVFSETPIRSIEGLCECVDKTTTTTPDDVMTTTSKPGTQGDPHFKTHSGEMYDFHGGCDLVLLENPDFAEGLGMTVHIRTKIETWWSYVEAAVLKIGEETVEIQQDQLHINGEAVDMTTVTDEPTVTKMAGLTLRYMRVGGNIEAHVYLANGEKILLKTYKGFVKVQLAKEGSEQYRGSHGLLGRFPDGKRVARDGETFLEDVNEFGQEWQVQVGEPKLFHTYDDAWVVPAGQKCAMPDASAAKQQLRQRRLANGLETEAAEKACAHLESADDRKACVYDVISTQDMDMAGAW